MATGDQGEDRGGVMGGRVTVLVGGEASGDRFALVETVAARDAVPPRHRHGREDEMLYVVAGELRVWRGGDWIEAPAGTAVLLPRGVEHTFAVITDTAHLLSFFAPAGFEGFHREIGGAREPPSLERLIAVAARYGCDITGPPPY